MRQALTTALYAALVVAGAGVVAFLGVTVPVGIVLVAVAGLLVRGRVPLPTFDPPAWGRLLRSVAVFALATAVGTIYLFTAQILVAAVTDARETGLFAASFRTFVVVGSIPGLLITVAFPLLSRAARDDRERLSYAVQRLLDVSIILGLGAALAVIIGAPAIMQVIAGDGFADAVTPLRIQGVTLLASFVLAPAGFALLSLHLHRVILIANGVALAVMLPSVATARRRLRRDRRRGGHGAGRDGAGRRVPGGAAPAGARRVPRAGAQRRARWPRPYLRSPCWPWACRPRWPPCWRWPSTPCCCWSCARSPTSCAIWSPGGARRRSRAAATGARAARPPGPAWVPAGSPCAAAWRWAGSPPPASPRPAPAPPGRGG